MYRLSKQHCYMFIPDTSFPLARHIVGPQNTRTLTVLGWTDDTKILNATPEILRQQRLYRMEEES